jgi:hypothetical protein
VVELLKRTKPPVLPWLFLFLLSFLTGTGQSRTTQVGIGYRPVFPAAFLGTGTETNSVQGVDFTVGLDRGFSGGMVIRTGLTELLSLEAGINYVKRNYSYSILDSAYQAQESFRLVGYELPVSLLAFVRLGEQVFMNASLGAGIDAFASSVATKKERTEQIAIKRHSANPALNANLGWEFRTSASGTIYLGATYHRPFQEIFLNSILYRNQNKDYVSDLWLSGSYLTADVRYYFKAEKSALKKSGKKKK